LAGKVPVKIQGPVFVSATNPDGPNPITITLPGVSEYLFEAVGDYGYGGDDPNNTVNRADAGYATGDAWGTRRDDLLGIPVTAKYRGVTSLLSDMGTGNMGIVMWGPYDATHTYASAYTPISISDTNVKFVISDWYDIWYAGDPPSDTNRNQNGMHDNAGGINVNVYECQEYGSISGVKFEDKNTNHVQDPGEGGLANWTIYIDSNKNNDQDAGEPTQITDPSGNFTFPNLTPGNYWVKEVNQAGWSQTRPTWPYQEVDLEPGENEFIYFGNFKLGMVQGRKFRDVNHDGVRQGGDSYLDTWDIYLFDSSWNQLKTMKTGDDTTEAGNVETGQYRFINLAKGDYYVCEDKKAGWDQTRPSSGPGHNGSICYLVSITTSGQEVAALTFGNFELGKVQGMKFKDEDGDGNPREDGEEFMNEWTIRLYKDWEGPVEVVTSNTGTKGQYRYVDLLPGTYQVCEVLKEGWTRTWPKVGDVPVADNGTLRPEYGQAVVNQNSVVGEGPVCWQTVIDTSGDFNQLLRFGNIQYGSIIGHKFQDNNMNGQQDSGENNLSGWTIGVYGGSGCEGQVIQYGFSQTDGNGDATFPNLIPGSYSVKEELGPQSGWQTTTPVCQNVTVIGGQQTTVNIGNFELARVQGCKFEDLNMDGARQSEIEGQIRDWKIRLYKQGEGSWTFVKEVLTGNGGPSDNRYYLDGLVLGTYYVCEENQAGWTQTGPNAGSGGVINLSGATDEAPYCRQINVTTSGQWFSSQQFGNIRLGNITVCKYDDYDGDGIKDDNEPGINGVNINLRHLHENGAENELTMDGVTGDGKNPQGCYTFANLLLGSYRITEDIASKVLAGYKPSGGTKTAYDVSLTQGGQTVSVDFFNDLQPIKLSLTKTSNKIGLTASPGDTINFTLAVTNDASSSAYGVSVRDVLPNGFSYVAGSTGGTGWAISEPAQNGQQLTWSVGDIPAGESRTITYQVKISSSQENGNYPDVAVASGTNRPSSPDMTTSYSNFAFVYTAVGFGVSLSASVGGSLSFVLGAATTAGQVLGAATGSSTLWLILAFLLIIAGLVLVNSKSIKKWLATLVLIMVGFSAGLFSTAKPVSAANLAVKITNLPEYKNIDNFKLSYTALQIESKPIQAQFYYHKEGDLWVAFGSTLTGETGSVDVTSSQVNSDAKYYFKVEATSNGETVSSETWTIIDRTPPAAPSEYSKEKINSNTYRLKWRTPNNDDLASVAVYRSKEQNFTADGGTLVVQAGNPKDTSVTWEDTGLEINRDYFYGLRSVDKAGNASVVTGDGGTVTYVEITPTLALGQVAGQTGQVVVLPKAKSGGSILGKEAEEATPSVTTEEEGAPAGTVKPGEEKIGGTSVKRLLLPIGGGLILLSIIGYFASRRRTS